MSPPRPVVGLFGCCDSCADCCCCMGACAFPSVAYGVNYALAVQAPGALACVMPCLVHSCLDSAVSCVTAGTRLPACLQLPFGCLLRANNRLAILAEASAAIPKEEEDEGWLDALLKEVFCWGCSLTQTHRLLLLLRDDDNRQTTTTTRFKGSALTGLLEHSSSSGHGGDEPSYPHGHTSMYDENGRDRHARHNRPMHPMP